MKCRYILKLNNFTAIGLIIQTSTLFNTGGKFTNAFKSALLK